MIEDIETILLPIPKGIKKSEITKYLLHQMKSHYPIPEDLIIDYYLTGKREKRVALVSYMLKEILVDNSELLHPHLLIKHRVWKTGKYYIKNESLELFIHIERGRLEVVESDPIEINNILTGDEIEVTESQLKLLYRKCKKDMFTPPKRSIKVFPLLLTAVALLSILSLWSFISKFEWAKERLTYLEQRTNRESLYNVTKEEIIKMENHINPSIYLILDEIYRKSRDIIIRDFTYNEGRINLTILTTNSLKLLQNLNSSPYLYMKLESTTPGEEVELSQLSGKILCP